MPRQTLTRNRFPVAMLLLGAAVFVWSGVKPLDGLTWILEVFPGIIAAILLVATYKRMRFSNLAYGLICLHAIILMIGGHYTYAEMPLFNWLRDALDLHRNYYDRLGHLFQGFVPAIIVRELLLRTSPLQRGKWLFTLVLCCCLAVSAAYELFEWAAAVVLRQGADQFLATQGDTWDTQWDMFCALIGATSALLLLRRTHDRSMRKVCPSAPAGSHQAEAELATAGNRPS